MDLVQTSSRQAEPPTVPIDALERDPHGVFRHYRKRFPFIKRSDGAALVLRNKDVQQFLSDPRTRQAETEFAELRGIKDGVLFDFFKYSMLTSNGSDHRRRPGRDFPQRSPSASWRLCSRIFARWRMS